MPSALSQLEGSGEPTATAAGLTSMLAWLASLLLLAFLCWPTILSLQEEWVTPTGHYSHGLLLLGLGSYFVWSHRTALRLHLHTPHVFGAAVLLGSYALWLIANLGTIVYAEYVALCGVALGLWLALFGWSSFRSNLWRFGIVALALPVWDTLNEPLQRLATQMVGQLLSLAGVPHHLEGTYVSLPNGQFEIASGCSGLGFVLTGLSLAFYLLATSHFQRRHLWQVIAPAVLIALLTNWVRIAVIIYVGYQSNMRSIVVEDHLWVGWLAFAVLAFPFFFYISGKIAPQSTRPETDRQQVKGLATGSAVLAAVVIVAIAGKIYLAPEPATQTQLTNAHQHWHIDAVAADRAECRALPPAFWEPSYEGADMQRQVSLCSEGGIDRTVWVNLALYLSEAQGKELIYYANDPLGVSRNARLERMESSSAAINQYRLNHVGRDYLLWQWYAVAGKRLAAPTATKLAQILAKLQRIPHAGSVTLLAACHGDCARAAADLESVMAGISNQPIESAPPALSARSTTATVPTSP